MMKLVGACCAVGTALAAQAAAFAGVDVPPPLPAKPVAEKLWDTDVTDPYRFLENVADPDVQKWMRGEADATAAIMSRIPGRDALIQRFKTIEAGASGLTTDVERTQGGRWFYQKRDPGENQFRLVWRDRTGREIGKLDDRKKYLDVALSPDAARVLVAIRDTGTTTGDV